MSEGASESGSHLILRSEVAAWLSDSVVKQVTIHQTSPDDARRIREEGARIEQGSLDAKWGQGFYTSTRPRFEYGEASVRVAVRLRRPLIALDQIDAQEYIDALLARASGDDIRAVLRAVGHDGVVIHWDSGETWAIAFENDQVRVVREG